VSIELESPSGIVSLLAQERSEDDAEDYPSSGWRFVTVRHWGETIVNGPWRIRAHESAALPPSQRGRGLLNGYQLTIYGY
jgi:subtilisin-like proprotein convertase family protein